MAFKKVYIGDKLVADYDKEEKDINISSLDNYPMEKNEYIVKDDGIYFEHTTGTCASSRLIMPKETFVEAFFKYCR